MRVTGYVYTRRIDAMPKEFINNWLDKLPFVEKLPDSAWPDSSLGRICRRMSRNQFLLIYELNDLGRNLLEALDIIAFAMDTGIIIHIWLEKGLLWREDESKVPVLSNPPRLSFGYIMSKLATMERARQSNAVKRGLTARKKRGIRLGRPPGTLRGNDKLDRDRDEILKRLKTGVTQAHIAREYSLAPSTVCDWVSKNREDT